eukprot:s7306_g2.t1
MQVTGYYVYFAEADGSLRSLLGNTTEDVHQIDFPSDQPTGTLSTILVYASSSLAEQTTPLALAFNAVLPCCRSDAGQSMNGSSEKSGHRLECVLDQLPRPRSRRRRNRSWTEPADPALVAHYET